MFVTSSPTNGPSRFEGVPTFFRGCCATARAGGSAGYDLPGYHLTLHLYENVPYDASAEEWNAEVDSLSALIAANDDEAALKWYDVHFPACMKLIPRKGRVRRKFLQGVREALERGI